MARKFFINLLRFLNETPLPPTFLRNIKIKFGFDLDDLRIETHLSSLNFISKEIKNLSLLEKHLRLYLF